MKMTFPSSHKAVVFMSVSVVCVTMKNPTDSDNLTIAETSHSVATVVVGSLWNKQRQTRKMEKILVGFKVPIFADHNRADQRL